MRRFLVVSHTVPVSGEWPLDDLAGAGGRVEVLCRIAGAALFLSHGIRERTEVYFVFVGDPARPATVRLEGGLVNRLQPDERSTAARLRQALRAAHPDPWWKEVQAGVSIAPFGLEETLGEAGGEAVLMHREGMPLEGAVLPTETLFILSDHLPFTPDEERILAHAATKRVSLGPVWYHGDHVVHVLQYFLDRRGHVG